ncbi:MAG: bifunctional acetate--CoA ligase family protein/GNAT family N-acetyltransferase, partial [Gammaproteobacteria bacterium]|nr:bifunctional acetate--CoA ligase family protein/GNAT family N-acetyltransferase [Gammaproteobacteria bacterium]
MSAHYLQHLFSPGSIALFGASERPESVGARVYLNLIQDKFSGKVYPINPKHKKIHGKRCYASINAVAGPVDLAIIATPKSSIPEIIHACGEYGVRAVIILSAGFNNENENGPELLKAILEEASRYRMRILGPNCLGLIRPGSHLNATFSKNTAQRGSLALISQSGALCTAIMDWAAPYEIGFSAIVSLGDAADIKFGDILDYLALDPDTKSILIYVEGIRDSRSFMSSLRSAARLKPVVIMKVGRHAESARAALTHTGSLVGADDVFDAAIRRAGVVRAQTVEQLFAAAQLLATTKHIPGDRLIIITNGGGPGIMATDRAIDCGIKLATLDESTIDRLNNILPAYWSKSNPVDILGDATPKHYADAVSICLQNKNIDGVLVILTPQAMTQPEDAARAVIHASQQYHKPVLTCWMGNQHVTSARELFIQHQIPTFTTPETAVEAFGYLVDYYHNQQLLLQVPAPLARHSEPDIIGTRMIIEGALSEKRTLLSHAECKALLSAFDIPVMVAHEAHSVNDALVAAESLGFPVVMKINSPDISHKSDVNGVRLNITNAQAVRSAYTEIIATVQKQKPDAKIEGVILEHMYHNPHHRELIVGVTRDPVFGPVITFGAGGVLVEIMRDRAVALPPLNTFIIDDLINQTQVSKLLGTFRNLPAINDAALKHLLRRLSEMVCELPQIHELDINPVVVNEHGAMVLDARIVVALQKPLSEPYEHMAIHPYPVHLVSHMQLSDGTTITIRPIRPEDAEIELAFVHNLSPESKYFRFMQALHELTPQMLMRFTQIDYDREMALIAVAEIGDKETEIGVARYVTNPDGESCEFAIVIADKWHKKGLGSHLLDKLIQVARMKRLSIIDGEVL